jgi:ribosome-binding protein aMBF1 (putative translation factor)
VAVLINEETDMNAQFITSPTGERLVVLAEADYQALVEAAEDAEDSAAARRFSERLASGEEELLPAEMVDRILDGENPTRVWREHRGSSVKDLAEKAGIAPAYLSQVETGKRDGTVATLRKLADALGVTLDDLAG